MSDDTYFPSSQVRTVARAPQCAPDARSRGLLRSPERRPRGSRRAGSGFPVVLTADRSLMASYAVLFDGMVAGSQTTRTPAALMRLLIAPRIPRAGRRAVVAPLGLRRVEAALAGGGWGPAEVAVVPPEGLKAVVGRDTVVIGISCGDPLGLGMNSTTMVGISGGRIYPSRWFLGLARRIARLRRRAPESRVVVGGPGAWQLAMDDHKRSSLGVDHVVCGYCEGNIAELFERMAAGERIPSVVEGRGVSARCIPPILAPALMGSVEVSRGCGLGCSFCTVGRRPMDHLPADTILADVETNVAGGAACLSLITEDVFRYGARGLDVRPGAVLELLQGVRHLAGARMVQTDHANVASVARFSGADLRQVHSLLSGREREGEGERDYVWLNLGVESPSGHLLAANGGLAKMGSCPPEEWGEFCLEHVLRVSQAGFFPLVSLMLGLPGETPADVERALKWVRRLDGERAAVFPVFYAPIDGAEPFGAAQMTRAHWRLVRECYGLNFKWIPRLVWNNQSRGGVALWRRLALQALGRLQMVWWKGLFAWRSRGVPA